MPFILVKNMQQEVILGNPFLTLLYPFIVTNKGIQTYFEGQKILFTFETQPICKEQNLVNLFQKKRNHTKQIKIEVKHKQIENLKFKEIHNRIKIHRENIEKDLCSSILNAFWDRKEHKISLPYVKGFDESKIPIKARPIQMNHELLEYCKQDINDLLSKGLIRESHSPWSCTAFYVNKPSEIERGTEPQG